MRRQYPSLCQIVLASTFFLASLSRADVTITGNDSTQYDTATNGNITVTNTGVLNPNVNFRNPININSANPIITNAGQITNTAGGPIIYIGGAGQNATVNNQAGGHIYNQRGSSLTGSTFWIQGEGLTLTNAGTISTETNAVIQMESSFNTITNTNTGTIEATGGG